VTAAQYKNRMINQHNYKDKPCSIKTYGNSFTQSQQVSDGEHGRSISPRISASLYEITVWEDLAFASRIEE